MITNEHKRFRVQRGLIMNIKDLGGEFELIKRLAGKELTDSSVIKGIGDDCAVLEFSEYYHLLVTTDMLVENDHFALKWQTPYQIGMKLMECNVSDIAAMGGIPNYAFVSLSLKKETSVEFLDELYKGLYESAEKHNVKIIGGDTTHGTEYVFNLCLLGSVKKELLRLRSSAKIKDLICVTGNLGGSKAGLELLRQNKTGFLDDYLEPKCRTSEEARTIAKYCNAMIDVSDGLGSEVNHICAESKCGAEIYYEKVPVSETTTESARTLNADAVEFALYGGEDFELVFTIPEEKVNLLRREFSDFTIVGKILYKEEGVQLIKDKKKSLLKKGFDHFD
ncbi:MAG: thiamine-phosphate kinase [Candidatus Diapherotrites archaeon]